MTVIASPIAPPPGPPSGCRTSQPPSVVVPTRPSLSTTSLQRSQPSHSQPNTPQSLATPRSHRFGLTDHPQKYSSIYEDSVSEKSFVTATSEEAGSDQDAIAKHDIPSTLKFIIYPQDEEYNGQRPEQVGGGAQDVQEEPSSSNVVVSVPEQPRTERELGRHQSRRFSESESTFRAVPSSEKRFSTLPTLSQKPKGTRTASVMSMGSTTIRNESITAEEGIIEETATAAEDDRFIMERWTKSLFYSTSSGRELFSTAKRGERKQYPVSSTCVLFWVGFIAPWCWLVGGWVPLGGVSVRENEAKRLKDETGMGADTEGVSRGEDGGGLRKWILPDPSSNFKATAGTASTSNDTALSSKEVKARLPVADPWVARCKIASIVGGTILALGLIAMVIVLGVVTD